METSAALRRLRGDFNQDKEGIKMIYPSNQSTIYIYLQQPHYSKR